MTAMQRKNISFAGSQAAVEYDDPQAEEMLDFLIDASVITQQDTPQSVFRIEIKTDDPSPYRYYLDGSLKSQTKQAGELAEIFQGDLCRQLVETSKDGMVFHAASVSHNGKGILIPGGIGAGKSTLTAWLISKGLAYLTDELVYIPLGTEKLIPYPRPLHIKRPSRAVLKPIIDLESPEGKVFSSSRSDLVPASLINQKEGVSSGTLSYILFPAYQHESQGAFTRLSQAQTAQHLLQCLINARNLPEFGFREAATLARKIPAYRLEYSNFDQIEQQLFATLG